MSDWPNYLFRPDFTEYESVLKDIPVGVADDYTSQLLLSVLLAGDPGEFKDRWNIDPMKTEFNLVGVNVVYNGLNHPNFATRSKFKYCLGIIFPENSTAPTGRIYLCWNEPVVVVPPVEETSESDDVQSSD